MLAVFLIEDPHRPAFVSAQRPGCCSAAIFPACPVASRALYEQNGQMGVWLYDVPGGTFVPVEVLANDGQQTR